MTRFVLIILAALCASCDERAMSAAIERARSEVDTYTLRPLLEAMPEEEAERFRSMLANP